MPVNYGDARAFELPDDRRLLVLEVARNFYRLYLFENEQRHTEVEPDTTMVYGPAVWFGIRLDGFMMNEKGVRSYWKGTPVKEIDSITTLEHMLGRIGAM